MSVCAGVCVYMCAHILSRLQTKMFKWHCSRDVCFWPPGTKPTSYLGVILNAVGLGGGRESPPIEEKKGRSPLFPRPSREVNLTWSDGCSHLGLRTLSTWHKDRDDGKTRCEPPTWAGAVAAVPAQRGLCEGQQQGGLPHLSRHQRAPPGCCPSPRHQPQPSSSASFSSFSEWVSLAHNQDLEWCKRQAKEFGLYSRKWETHA